MRFCCSAPGPLKRINNKIYIYNYFIVYSFNLYMENCVILQFTNCEKIVIVMKFRIF